MNSPSKHHPPAPDEPLVGTCEEISDAVEEVSAQGVRAVHPPQDGAEVVPTGNFPRRAETDSERQDPQPARAQPADQNTEIITALPDPLATTKRRKRNRKALGPAKLLAIFLAAQVVIGLLAFAIFGELVRSWLAADTNGPDGVSATEAAALRDDVKEATAGFAKFEKDLSTVKKQIAVSPGDAWAELEILAKRNQLTMLADDAITNGSRLAYDELLANSKDVSIEQRLRDGAAAEILRVKDFYASGTRLGSYKLPIATLFPSLKTETEEKLETSVLIRLLGDQERSWRVRTRAAYLLAGRRDLAVSEALVRAVQTDANLDVVKESVFTFEENTGYRSRGLFEVQSLLDWWTVYEARADVPSTSSDPG